MIPTWDGASPIDILELLSKSRCGSKFEMWRLGSNDRYPPNGLD